VTVVDDPKINRLKAKLGEGVEVLTWGELMPVLKKAKLVTDMDSLRADLADKKPATQ
jgi:hypothetical protein